MAKSSWGVEFSLRDEYGSEKHHWIYADCTYLEVNVSISNHKISKFTSGSFKVKKDLVYSYTYDPGGIFGIGAHWVSNYYDSTPELGELYVSEYSDGSASGQVDLLIFKSYDFFGVDIINSIKVPKITWNKNATNADYLYIVFFNSAGEFIGYRAIPYGQTNSIQIENIIAQNMQNGYFGLFITQHAYDVHANYYLGKISNHEFVTTDDEITATGARYSSVRGFDGDKIVEFVTNTEDARGKFGNGVAIVAPDSVYATKFSVEFTGPSGLERGRWAGVYSGYNVGMEDESALITKNVVSYSVYTYPEHVGLDNAIVRESGGMISIKVSHVSGVLPVSYVWTWNGDYLTGENFDTLGYVDSSHSEIIIEHKFYSSGKSDKLYCTVTFEDGSTQKLFIPVYYEPITKTVTVVSNKSQLEFGESATCTAYVDSSYVVNNYNWSSSINGIKITGNDKSVTVENTTNFTGTVDIMCTVFTTTDVLTGSVTIRLYKNEIIEETPIEKHENIKKPSVSNNYFYKIQYGHITTDNEEKKKLAEKIGVPYETLLKCQSKNYEYALVTSDVGHHQFLVDLSDKTTAQSGCRVYITTLNADLWQPSDFFNTANNAYEKSFGLRQITEQTWNNDIGDYVPIKDEYYLN